jgi:hypothetical protein
MCAPGHPPHAQTGSPRGKTSQTPSFRRLAFARTAERVLQPFQQTRGSIIALVASIPMVPGSIAAKGLTNLFTLLQARPPEEIATATNGMRNLLEVTLTLAAISAGANGCARYGRHHALRPDSVAYEARREGRPNPSSLPLISPTRFPASTLGSLAQLSTRRCRRCHRPAHRGKGRSPVVSDPAAWGRY